MGTGKEGRAVQMERTAKTKVEKQKSTGHIR